MKFKTRRYIVKRKHAFQFAFYGINELLQESHFKIHLIASAVVVLSGILLKVSFLEWAVLLVCIGMVLTAEAINSAIETTCDLVMPSRHPLVKRIKDISAGAVLIAAAAAALAGLLIFLPKLYLWAVVLFS
ncbi:MAG: diacylglycerol kinase family protein [Thermaurantimonas sp.]|uniref:diacylglycerol kinase family protein n=1 Tax=Thermaurantimonas sp. TaxID=2681568 RepID=UPI00391C44FF